MCLATTFFNNEVLNMRYDKVLLADLRSYLDCANAIEAIESDPANTAGGFKAWGSGYQTHLTKGAQRKIQAIQRKADKFSAQFSE